MPREWLVVAVERLVGKIRPPSTRYISDKKAHRIAYQFDLLKYKLAVKLLSDLTDNEAHKVFGRRTSANEVHEMADIDRL